MYNISQITSTIQNLVGFGNEAGYILDESLTSPTSTLEVNGHEALLTLQVIDSVKPSNLTLDEFLIKQRKQSTQAVIADIINTKLANQVQKSILQETPLINGTANLRNIESKNGRFVGWIFRLPESLNLQHTIKKVMLQFTENLVDLPLYVYHSSQQAPIQTINLTTTNAPSVSTIELETPILMTFLSNTTDAGGFYLVGYYEDDLPTGTNAIYKEINVGDKPCGSCDPWAVEYYKKWNGYINTQAVYVYSADLNGTSVPNQDDIEVAFQTNFGLNFFISIGCELTSFIITHKDMFASIIQTKLSIDLLRYVETSTTRNNKISDSASKEASIRINGIISENNFIKVGGLAQVYDKQLKGVNFDFSRLDKYCLPNTRSGIKWNY